MLRRLQGAAAAEGDLRHMLRRRDIRIEELKHEQATADRLARSSAGTPWSILGKGRPPLGVRDTFDSGGAGITNGSKERTVEEQAEREVSQAATIRRLELELAEAAARGDVGEAVTRGAEKLAHRLFEQAGGDSGLAGGEYRLCSRCLLEEGISAGMVESRGRGVSFLRPSAEVELKAAAAAAAAATVNDEANETETAHHAAVGLSPTASNTATDNNVDLGAASRVGGGKSGRGHSIESPGDDLERSRVSPHPTENQVPPAGSSDFSNGVRSLEAQLLRLEAISGRSYAVSAGGRPDYAGPGGGSGAFEMAWTDAVRELRVQVAGLRNRAEVTEQVLNVSAGRGVDGR